MNQSRKWLVAGLAVVVLGAAAFFYWQQNQIQSPPPEPPPRPKAIVIPVAPAPVAPPPLAAPAPVPPPPAPPAPPPIRNPIEQIQAPAPKPAAKPLPTLAASDKVLKDDLTELLTRKSVLTFLNVDDFVRRSVATVDNLALGHAASRLWPVVPTPEKFMVEERADGVYMADANSARYTPFVRFATSINTAKAAALYARLYPLFQQAYEELGYPGKYFNDRLVEVIDQMLLTPELSQPVKLTLTQVQGPIPSSQPWTRYEFDDPALEALPAGQKIMIRMGRDNELLIKAKLKEFRERVVNRKSVR
jgi:hypothetical protein